VLSRVALSVFLTAIFLPLRGQQDGRDQGDGPIKMQPELALAIPWTQRGHDVTVKFPVMINRTTVLTPGMILRNLYVPPNNLESENLAAAHMGNMAESFSRDTAMSADAAAMSSNEAHAIERERRVVWEVPVNFQLAIAQLPTDQLHLIYQPTTDNRNLVDTSFDFFEGILLGSPTGKVTVLAVEIGSKADHAGFKVGDEIVAVGGTPVPDLSGFPQVYVAAREKAKEYNATTFSFTVQSSDHSQNRTLNVPMPPTIKSQLMDGF